MCVYMPQAITHNITFFIMVKVDPLAVKPLIYWKYHREEEVGRACT